MMWILAGGLLLYATTMVCLTSERFWLPGWLQGVGWVLLPGSALLLFYSLFVELPFSATYRNSHDTPHLVTTGTYALVRHPTVAWYALFIVSLLLAFQAKPLLLALPLWIALDVLWVVLQERLVLGKVLPGYEQYRQATPMLIPNRRSVAVFLKGLHLPRALERSLQER